MTEGIFRDNAEEGRFEYHVGDLMAYATYHMNGSIMSIAYVEAPPALRGTGAAGNLMQKIMETARERGCRVIPICSYAAAWIRRDGKFTDLLVE
jgi:uncharacterized protein